MACWRRASAVLALLLALRVIPAAAVDHVTVKAEGRSKRYAGQILAEAAEGLLLKTADNAYHRIMNPTFEDRSKDASPLEMLSAEDLATQLLEELPPGFQVHQSTNYVICYNTTRTYAQWTSTLLERLQKAFISHWPTSGNSPFVPAGRVSLSVASGQYAGSCK